MARAEGHLCRAAEEARGLKEEALTWGKLAVTQDMRWVCHYPPEHRLGWYSSPRLGSAAHWADQHQARSSSVTFGR